MKHLPKPRPSRGEVFAAIRKRMSLGTPRASDLGRLAAQIGAPEALVEEIVGEIEHAAENQQRRRQRSAAEEADAAFARAIGRGSFA